MSATIRSLVIPVSDVEAAKAVYCALLGAPHTDAPYYVGFNVDGFEVALAPGDVDGGPVAYADVEDLDAVRETLLAAGATQRSAPRQVAPSRASACSRTPTETRSGCAAGSPAQDRRPGSAGRGRRTQPCTCRARAAARSCLRAMSASASRVALRSR